MIIIPDFRDVSIEEVASKATPIDTSPQKGEVKTFPDEHFHAGGFLDSDYERSLFCVHGTLVQKSTKSKFRIQKYFENYDSAKDYLELLVSENPIGNYILFKMTQKDLLFYQ